MKKVLLATVFLTISLQAHSLKIFSSKDENFLHVKSYFNASSPCIECDVVVLSAKKDVPFSFKTNDQGEVDIPLDILPTKVTVTAGLGHKNSLIIEENMKKNSTVLPYPFWVKILLGLCVIGGFFALFFWIKRR